MNFLTMQVELLNIYVQYKGGHCIKRFFQIQKKTDLFAISGNPEIGSQLWNKL